MSKEIIRSRPDEVASTIDRGDPGGSEMTDGPAPPDSAALEVTIEDLVVGYPGSDEPVIDGESATIPAGSVTALVGPNGSGKSTLLKGMAGQVEAREGSVYLDGREIAAFDTKVLARKLGLLSQENVAPDSITVEGLIEHGRYPHRGFFEQLTPEDRDAIERAIALTGIEELRDRSVGSLSGGQKQLVWIAMVLAQDTDVLLLDEPTTFLDLRHELAVMEVIKTLREDCDITVVVVLHDIERAARIADHVIALHDGSIAACGRPEAVFTESLLASVFGIEAVVNHTPHGLQITALHPVSDDQSAAVAVSGEAGSETD